MTDGKPVRPPKVPKLTDLVGTTEGGPGVLATPSAKWNGRASRLLGKVFTREAREVLQPYLREAQELLPAMMEQVCAAAGGECGPIEALVLSTAVRQAAIARFFMDKAAGMEDPVSREALKVFETGSRLADCSRMNSLAAYDLAVRVSRHKPAAVGDPLAAFDVPAEPENDPE